MTRADVIERTARALFDIHVAEIGSGLEWDSPLMALQRDNYRAWAGRLADAGVLAVSPPPTPGRAAGEGLRGLREGDAARLAAILPPAGDPADPDLAPLVCGVDGCNRGSGHEGAHKTSKGRLTRTWKAGTS